ncbi:multiple epidermal growth factor-like domains protein 9 isoform X2 [Salmo salar]|uniref:Multiple epidermal growth factor-like domains protein 9 isoform X2 n=1 Tax=Salmo salar TaxID=8030 RepID=A0A1S3M545_SALSA|nr:multiple epidermal growth factor-like domains protein 9 isoform X2 [Salmo salar]|eukprot:XP_013998111.1 PREDICTED: multiple epidermal growth factor-like domains protein 9 isoform X2 [Salmo salar]
MKCELRTMLRSTMLELLLFSLTAGLYRAAPRASNNNELSVSKQPAMSEITLGQLGTTMPNYLPEDNVRLSTISALSPVSTATTSANRITGIFRTTTPTASTISTSRTPETKTHSKPTSQPLPVPTTDTQQTEFLCNCSSEGSLDLDHCNRSTGQCVCLLGYMGLQCADCQEAHFNNGTTGCIPCSCDSYGALGPLCDSSGMCVCKTGVYGDKCDDCHPGFFRFSSTGCQPCQCNNHSNYCHPQSGICLNCQGNTKGPGCEECKYNFYRRPGTALTEVCVPCPCSSVTSSGSCHIDPRGQSVCDQCKPEYQGPHCDQCRGGFYNADSICLPCNCSGNAEPGTSPRICNPETGHCLSCVNNTSGKHCERCAEGYVGSAIIHSCKAIVTPTPEQNTTLTLRSTTTTLSSGHTMTSTSNATTTQLTTTASSTTPGLLANTTAAISEVSWTQFNVIILAVIIVVVVVLMGVAGGVYTYREYRNRKLNAPFWTIELKEDNISISSYHDSLPNMGDVSGLLEEEASMEVAPNGQLALSSPINMYKA